MTDHAPTEPVLSPDLLARILDKLELTAPPAPDLSGLNRVFGAYCGHVPGDNIQKRIWLTGPRTGPVTGGDPVEFFENWLEHGTGGTCFPAGGGLYTLLRALGFDAHRISGAVLLEGVEQNANHGSVRVMVDGRDYLTDAQHQSFTALPLDPERETSTGDGIHDIRAFPLGDGAFDLLSFPGSNRTEPLRIRFPSVRRTVDHDFFLTHYALSARRDRIRSPFNEALFVSRKFPDAIVIVGRGNKIVIAANNTVTKNEITEMERNRLLVEELGISEQAVAAIPPDEEGGFIPPK